MHPGDRFTVETPGGAAWSPPRPHGVHHADVNAAERAQEG
jgi:N-methylhydantoinase B/oxoprolinase/acetone carboxylase alpha subunit